MAWDGRRSHHPPPPLLPTVFAPGAPAKIGGASKLNITSRNAPTTQWEAARGLGLPPRGMPTGPGD